MRLWRVLTVIALAIATMAMSPADDLDTLIQTQMARRQIAGLSLAIIHQGRIVDARAYGTTSRGGKIRVTTTTLFQAGSVSKPVSALGALTLVQTGKLSLDEDVNTKLKSREEFSSATEKLDAKISGVEKYLLSV